MSRSTPKTAIVAAGFFILLVLAVVDTGPEDVLTYHFGEIVLPSVEVLSVVPRPKVPEETAGAATPTQRLGGASAVQLATLREYGGKRSLDGIVQRGGVSSKCEMNPVSRPRKCEVVGRGAADRGSQFRNGHLSWLVPSVADRGIGLLAPESAFPVRVQWIAP